MTAFSSMLQLRQTVLWLRRFRLNAGGAGDLFPAEGRERPQFLYERRHYLDHFVDLLFRVVTAEGEPDRAVYSGEGHTHGP